MKIKHRHFATIDSTSLYIKENFENVPDFSFVSADFQFMGKGRNDRQWFSPIGENLLFSFVIKDPNLVNRYGDLSIASAYVIAKYLEDKFDLKPMIKWPNDVYIGDKKICGILCQSHMNNDEMDGLIIGIGLNINQILFNQGVYVHPATSLKDILHKDFSVEEIRDEIFIRIVKELLSIKEGNDNYIQYAMNHNYLKDKEVYIDVEDKEEKVKVITLNYDCSLRVELNEEFFDLISGEIHFTPRVL